MQSDDLLAHVVHIYDRKYWSSMQIAWQEGLTALCPAEIGDIEEWRESARRLASHLDCHVATGLTKIRLGNGEYEHRYFAKGNDGFPLGITDPHERDAWQRQRAEADA